MRLVSASPAQTERIGQALGRTLRPGAVVALFGPMGAGKTVFVRGLAKALGCDEPILSPTFALAHEHAGSIPLFHFDMFRLRSPEELFFIGWDDYLSRGGVCAVEWSENVLSALPPDCVRVRISPGDGENLRVIEIEGADDENIIT